MLDTAGRLTLDEELMREAAEVRRAANPHEVLLVADALTGQDAVNLAKSFNERLDLTGIVLTRIDGDGRGGAALSMRAVTGKPIKLIGTGEKLDAHRGFLSAAHRRPHSRHGRHHFAGRKSRRRPSMPKRRPASPQKCARARSILPICASSSRRCRSMGGMSGLMSMMPGIAKMKNQLAERNLDETVLKRQMAIIDFDDTAGTQKS